MMDNISNINVKVPYQVKRYSGTSEQSEINDGQHFYNRCKRTLPSEEIPSGRSEQNEMKDRQGRNMDRIRYLATN